MKIFSNRHIRSLPSIFNNSPILGGACVFFLSFLFYLYTLAPGVIWGDSARFASEAANMHLSFGADAHPLFVILGHLFSYLPFEIAYSMNLLSAITASLAVLNVYYIIEAITGSKISSIIGAASLCVSHAFWLHAVTAEVYDLNAFFVTVVLLVLLKWREKPENHSQLHLAAFLFGLGLCNHLIMALTVFGFLFLLIATDYKVFLRIKVLLILGCSFLAGFSIQIYLYLQKIATGTSSHALINAATGGKSKKAMLVMSLDVFRDIFMYFAYLFYQFPFAGFLLGFIGIVALYRKNRKIAISFLLILGCNMVFFLTFGPGVKKTTKYTFYISDYALFSIFVGYGFYAFGNFLRERGYSNVSGATLILVVLAPVVLYTITPSLSKKLNVDLLHARTVPYRDNETFFLNPNKRGYIGAAIYAEEALGIASSNSIIIADYSINTVLMYYQQVKGVRKDILILDSRSHNWNIPEETITLYYGKRDIYLADMEKGYYKIGNLKKEFDFVPEGILYKVVRKSDKEISMAMHSMLQSK